jgi:membrane-bound lytic murein transglycosylase D
VDDVAVLVREATDRYVLGEEAYRSGELDRARKHFDEAVLVFIESGFSVPEEPRLQRAFERILSDIQSLEAEALAAADEGGPGLEQTPMDELRDITSFLSAEELAAEMEKVRAPAESDQFSIPIVLNERVLTMMEAFENKFRDAFIGGYRRMGRYEEMIRRTLGEEGLPEDLIYLAFVESTFKTNAYSRARAKGMWQFMASTGRRYGLSRDYYVDERSDPEKATRAAARYLKDLYDQFGDWYLALAAYNAGEGKVIRAIERTGRDDFWELARTRHLRRETRNFVPSILAISIMARDPERHGFEGLKKDPTLRFDRVSVEDAANLSLVARLTGSSVKELRALNPELRRSITPPGVRGYELRVPGGTGARFRTAYAALPASEKIAAVDTIYRVRRGDTLSGIARRQGTSVSAICRANGISRNTTLRIGMRLRVPGAHPRGPSYVDFSGPVAGPDGRYVVHRGDTLWAIALRHGSTVAKLAALNGISSRATLYPGQVLRVKPGSGSALARERSEGRGESTYMVRRGDTLSAIARRHGTTVAEIAALNDISSRSVIHPGQVLHVNPRSTTSSRGSGGRGQKVRYTVRRGDSLYEIALRHGTTVERLKAWNRIRRGNLIHPGEVLTIYMQ